MSFPEICHVRECGMRIECVKCVSNAGVKEREAVLQQLQRWPSVPGECDAESQMDTRDPRDPKETHVDQLEY